MWVVMTVASSAAARENAWCIRLERPEGLADFKRQKDRMPRRASKRMVGDTWIEHVTPAV